jgi:hypothetical protein
MKKFTVTDGATKRRIDAESPESAYQKYLKLVPEVKSANVVVYWGLMGCKTFTPHIPKEQKQKQMVEETNRHHSPSMEKQLNEIWDILNHMRWILLGIGALLIIGLISPQCAGMFTPMDKQPAENNASTAF